MKILGKLFEKLGLEEANCLLWKWARNTSLVDWENHQHHVPFFSTIHFIDFPFPLCVYADDLCIIICASAYVHRKALFPSVSVAILFPSFEII
jgi:hypothetical protein